MTSSRPCSSPLPSPARASTRASQPPSFAQVQCVHIGAPGRDFDRPWAVHRLPPHGALRSEDRSGRSRRRAGIAEVTPRCAVAASYNELQCTRPDKTATLGPKKRRRGYPTAPRSIDYAATSTLICLGLASSRSGRRTVSTPALYWALTLPESTVGGSANVRANEP